MHWRMRIRPVMPLLVASMLLTTFGCAHVNREELATDLDTLRDELRAELRAEQQAASEQLGGRIDGVDARVDGLDRGQSELAGRMERLESELRELEAEFGVTIERLENTIAFSVPVHFDFDSAAIEDDQTSVLHRFAGIYREYYGGDLVTVEGFTDEAGSEAYNLQLGQRRAEGVKSYLTEVAGLDPLQLRAVSYGEALERLVAPGLYGPDRGRENRRVVLVIDGAAPSDGGSQQ